MCPAAEVSNNHSSTNIIMIIILNSNNKPKPYNNKPNLDNVPNETLDNTNPNPDNTQP